MSVNVRVQTYKIVITLTLTTLITLTLTLTLSYLHGDWTAHRTAMVHHLVEVLWPSQAVALVMQVLQNGELRFDALP